jgi:hypothetical protein
MKQWTPLISFMMGLFFLSIPYAAPPSPDVPPTSTVESLVKSYVDEDFIHEELPPPEKCDKYSEKLMFAYDWTVVIVQIGQYDPARKFLPVEAQIIVRCGPVQPLPQSSDKGASPDFPLRSETPIDFQMVFDPKHPQQWKVHEVTLWKSKQKVIEQ